MELLKKIINKLHLSGLMYTIQRKFIVKHGSICYNTAEDALAYLHTQSSDLGKTCITNRMLVSSDCDVEVIVPCYNAERYIAECIDSILAQKTNYSFFVTIIDDGSTDRTPEILRKYANIENVKVIKQENKGHSGARNTGIEQAHGRYLLFVDSDDILIQGSIEELMSLADRYDADVVDSGYIRFADKGCNNLKQRAMACLYDLFQRPQVARHSVSSSHLSGYPWGKVWKTTLFQNVHFPEGYWFEDTLVWMILEPLCRRKVTTEKLSLRYRMNPNSISHLAHSFPKSIDSLYITLKLLEDRCKLDIKFNQYQYDCLLRQMRNNFYRVGGMSSEIKQAVFAVEQDLITKKFAGWTTFDTKIKPIEEFLRTGDYYNFELWCNWH